ncbi:MAG: metal ABC transporter permease [Phycisphaerales bacterium]|nr:metal ABC transporter permease [Phycisphaerales bacterium]
MGERGLLDVLLLQDYNTALVVLGTTTLGVAAGVCGTLLLLRKRSLLGDVVSHATLPGVVAAFLVMQACGGTGKSLPGLLLGATVTGLLAAWLVPVLRRASGLKDDAIMGVVLGSSFGLGIALLGIALNLPSGNQAGLEGFIFGKTASMVRVDALIIGLGAAVVIAMTLALAKDFRLLCFDEQFAASIGRPVALLDAVLMMLAVAVIVIGLQAVGLILMIALLIIPAAAARFWTDGFIATMCWAGGIGAVSGWMGSTISAMHADLPAGAVIVLVTGCCFALSMACGRRHGLTQRWWRGMALRRRVERQHLLRAMLECGSPGTHVALNQLHANRRWRASALQRELRRAVRSGELDVHPEGWVLTPLGEVGARRVVRNHRLWELFLIHHADIAPSHVDRDADLIEHVLDAELVAELEALLDPGEALPSSPHPLERRAP